MARQTTTRGNDRPDAFPGAGLDAAMTAALRSFDIALERSAAINRSFLDFLAHRLEEEVVTSRRMTDHGGDLAGMIGLQADFVRRMGRDYVDQANRVLGMTSELSVACLEPYREQARSATDRIVRGTSEAPRAAA